MSLIPALRRQSVEGRPPQSLRPTWSTLQVPGQAELHSETLSQKQSKTKQSHKTVSPRERCTLITPAHTHAHTEFPEGLEGNVDGRQEENHWVLPRQKKEARGGHQRPGLGVLPFALDPRLREAPWLGVIREMGVSMKAELNLAGRTRKNVAPS